MTTRYLPRLILATMLVAVTALVAATWLSGSPAYAGGDATAKLYASKCGSCHGKDGAGNAKFAEKLKLDPADLNLLDEASLVKSIDEWVNTTKNGQGKMRGYDGKLTDEQILAVNEYVRSLAP
jgi:cytochrome c6